MKDIETHKTRLDEMLAELTKELEVIGIHNPQVKEDWIAVPDKEDKKDADLNDAADKVEEWNERRAVVATLETRYNNIQDALKRIEDGTYGKCVVCGGDIEEERLAVNAAAATCVEHIDAPTA